MSLHNKTIVITGGGSGLGADAARAARAAGANVVLNGRSRDKLVAIADEIDPSGKHVAFVDGDIGDPDTAGRLISTAAETFGGVDVLYNNAGIFGIKRLADVIRSDLSDYFNLMAGYFTVTQLAVHEMRKRGGGSIVNIGSGCNYVPFPTLVSYTASKGGLEMLTKVASLSLAPHQIRVNCIAPGAILVERTRHELPDYAGQFARITPMGRVGMPEDVAGTAVFLASDASRFVTGQTIAVDGGLFNQPPRL
jgi:NAD(P)-dependent dehydrogenase (short-subunit alcohol dehydrogenase family)